MTLEKFNEIKQAGIDKWEPALELKTQEAKMYWWVSIGSKSVHFVIIMIVVLMIKMRFALYQIAKEKILVV